MARLGDVCEKRIDTIKATYTGDIDYIDISSIDNKSKKITEIQSISIVDAPSRAKQLVFPGDILVSTVRPNLNAVALVTESADNTLVASTGYCVLRCLPNTYNKYVFYFCQSPAFIEKMVTQATGASYPAVTSSIVKECTIPLPPLEEQRRIAALLDQVSDLIAMRRAQLDKLDLLVKARFVEMFGDPVSNPMKWEKCMLETRCDIITGNTPSRAETENYGTFIEWIKSDNINTPNMFLTTAQEYLSEIGFEKCRYVEAGCLLMTCIAGSLSCIGNVAITDRQVAFNQQINAIVPKQDEVIYLYWLMVLSKSAIHSTINMALKGILSKGQLSKLEFPFPPLDVQKSFAAFVEQTEKSKLTIQQSLHKLETLKKSLMQQYFR